jgi:MFS family permease
MMRALRAALRQLARSARAFPATYWWLVAGLLVNRLGTFVIPYLSMYLTERRGIPVTVVGLLVSLMGAGAMVASPVGGVLADRWGRRGTMLLSTAAGGAAMLALGFAGSIPAIAALALALGFLGDLFRPAMHAAIADVVPPERRVSAFGIVYWVANIGWAFSMPVAGLLTSWSWLLLFAGDGLTTLLFGLVVFVRVPETRPREAIESTGHPLAGLGHALADPAFRGFLFLQFLLVLLLWQSALAMPVDMTANKGLAKTTFGLVAALNPVLVVLFQPLGIRLARGRSPSSFLAAGAVLAGAGFGLFAFASPGAIGAYLAGVVLYSAGEIANTVVAAAVVAGLAPAAHRGAYQGSWTMMWGLGHMVAPALGGLVLDTAGPRALWTGCLALGLAAGAAHLALARRLGARLAEARAAAA